MFKFLGAVATCMLLASPVVADTIKMKCGCYKAMSGDTPMGLNGKVVDTDTGKIQLECVSSEVYSNLTSSVSIQESHVKIYVDSSNIVQGDSDMNIRFRPRDKKCLVDVKDMNANSSKWVGMYCGQSSYKDIGGFKIDSKTNSATFAVVTTGKTYGGTAIFTEKGTDGKRSMIAACLQNQ